MSRNLSNASKNCRNNRRWSEKQLRIYAVLVILLVFVLAGMQPVLAQDANPAAAVSYAQNCTVCHGEDAMGAMPGTPDLLAERTWAAYSNDELVKRIQEGIKTSASPSGMPPNAGNPSLTEVELRLAIEHLRRLLAAGK